MRGSGEARRLLEDALMFFRWLLDRARKPPAWIIDRNAKCERCRVPFQAHTRELHAFVSAERDPKKRPPPGS